MIEILESDIELSGRDYSNFYGRKPFDIVINHSWQYAKEANEIQQQILQGQRLIHLLQNTTIDMTSRERSLLDLLLEQSRETETQDGKP